MPDITMQRCVTCGHSHYRVTDGDVTDGWYVACPDCDCINNDDADEAAGLFDEDECSCVCGCDEVATGGGGVLCFDCFCLAGSGDDAHGVK